MKRINKKLIADVFIFFSPYLYAEISSELKLDLKVSTTQEKENQKKPTGKKAIIVGASSGIGKAVAKKLAAEGCDIIGLVARRLEKLQETANEIQGQAVKSKKKILPTTYIKQIDVTKRQQAQQELLELIDQMGGLDLIVISLTSFHSIIAGIATEESTVDVDVKGFWSMAQVAVEFFEKQKTGHLVGISSIDAIRGNALCPT